MINQKNKKNIILIIILILTIIYIHVGLTKLLEKRPFEIKYNFDDAICGNCLGLDWRNNHRKKVAKKAINKNDDEKTPKEKIRQIRKEN